MSQIIKKASEELFVLGALRLLDNQATTSQINAKLNQMGYKADARKALRRLKKSNVVESFRADKFSLELTWKFVEKEQK